MIGNITKQSRAKDYGQRSSGNYERFRVTLLNVELGCAFQRDSIKRTYSDAHAGGSSRVLQLSLA